MLRVIRTIILLCAVSALSFVHAIQEPCFRFATEVPEPFYQPNYPDASTVNTHPTSFNNPQFRQQAANYHHAVATTLYAVQYAKALMQRTPLPDFSTMHSKLPDNFTDSFEQRGTREQWFTKDIARDVHERTVYNQLMRQCGHYFTTTQLVQHQYACMRDWKQYYYNGFREFIRAFPLYEDYILELDAECKRKPQRVTQITSAEPKAYEFITQEANRIRTKRDSEKLQKAQYVAAYNYEQRQLRAQEFFKEQAPLLDTYFAKAIENNPDRLRAYQQTIASNALPKECLYALSSQAQQYLADSGLDHKRYHTLRGNALQHQLHQEIMHGVEKMAIIARPAHSKSFDCMMHSSTLDTFYGACRANEMGDCMSAIKLIDLGSAMADYCVAIAQGVFEGVVEGTRDAVVGTYHMVRHPIDSAKALWNVALKMGSIMHDHLPLYKPYCLCSTEQEKQAALAHHTELVRHWAQADEKLSRWWNETPTRDKIHDISKNTTGLLTNVFVVGKCLNILGKACTIANTEALAFYQKSNSKVLTTAAGTNLAIPVELVALSEAERIIEAPATVLLEKVETSLQSLKIKDRPLNFTNKTITRMENPDRMIPIQILNEILQNPIAVLPDVQGSKALMYYSQMWKNGKQYNVEVLYDCETNTIFHFLYDQRSLGPLGKIQ